MNKRKLKKYAKKKGLPIPLILSIKGKKNKMLTGGQAAIAAKAPPPNKIDAKDLAVLRAEKAKGRGMGLQDEKVKPGKVMKAKRGVFSSGKISDMSFDEKMKRVESGQINKKTGKFTSMNAMRDAKGFQKGESAAEFNKRRMKLTGAKKALSASRIGKIVLPIAAAGVAAQQYLKSKMNKKKDVKKKMGGGMMQKPIGYKSGMGPAGAAGSMAGRPGGRRPMTQGPKGGIGSLGKEKKENIPNIIITKGGAYKYTKPKVDEKKGRHLRQHKSYDASPRLISEAKGKTFSLRSMNVGGMTKPMGYSTGRSISTRGGGVDSSIIGKIRDAGPFKRIPLGKSRMTDEDRKKIRQLMEKRSSRKKGLETAKRVASTVASVASPVTAAASAAYKLANKMKDKDRMTDRDLDKAKSLVGTSGSKNRPIKKDHSSRNPNPKTPKMMGGGMMKPMGYSKGVMVKARGCKLGRTKPTKIT